MTDTPPAASTPPEPELAPDSRLARLSQLIRNGLANTPISQSFAAWHALETRLPEIVDAIIKEL